MSAERGLQGERADLRGLRDPGDVDVVHQFQHLVTYSDRILHSGRSAHLGATPTTQIAVSVVADVSQPGGDPAYVANAETAAHRPGDRCAPAAGRPELRCCLLVPRWFGTRSPVVLAVWKRSLVWFRYPNRTWVLSSGCSSGGTATVR